MSACKTRSRRLFGFMTVLGILAPFGSPAETAEPRDKAAALTHRLFALCIDTHDAKRRTLAEQARMLKELGYAGVGHLWLEGVPERLQTLDEHGLKLFQLYVRVSIDPKQPKYDPRLKDVIALLKGRPTILGVLVSGGKPSDPAGDDRAVSILREVADWAAQSGLRVALYPHTGDWLERVEDAVRVAKKVDRPNLGVMFNLCHWLKVQKSREPGPVLQAAMPYLFCVTINGADRDGQNWDRLIQPLGRGDFDVFGLLETLQRLGYQGPIGLQCYGIPGDARDHLQQSMEAWRDMVKRLGDGDR